MIRKCFASILAMLFVFATVGTFAGCNTVEGAGKDIEQGGKALKNEANEQKSRM